MLKRKYMVFAAVMGLAVTAAGIPVSAAEIRGIAAGNITLEACRELLQQNGIYITSNAQSAEQLLEQLRGCGIELPECEWNVPETEAPDAPETEVPDMPETEAPDVPETEAPDVPETEVPNVPETEVPETDVPDVPETEAPDVPETEAPDVPETEAPSQPETERPETNNSFQQRVFQLVNQERMKENLPLLTYDASIEKAALVRAKETETSFSHTRPNGSSFSTALSEGGVSFRGAGENIAWGQKSPEEVMRGWMNSEGHRANIMNPNYTKIGVGYYQNSKGVNYWVQLFTY